MEEILVLLKSCSDQFSETEEYRILKTYRTRDNRLSFDERLSIAKSVERIYAPFFKLMKDDAPTLTDSDLLFCALIISHVETVAIAECLTVTKDAIRMRKLRLREKLPSKWFYVLFPEQKRNCSDNVTSRIEDAQKADIPLPSEPAKNAKDMKEKMSFGKAVASCFKKYLVFDGRARRSEYWYFFLFCIIVNVCFELLDKMLSTTAYLSMSADTRDICRTLFTTLDYVIDIGLMLPTFSVTIRRLHDRDDNGWLAVLIFLIPWTFNMTFKVLVGIYGSDMLDVFDRGADSMAITMLFVIYLLVCQIVLIFKLVLFCKAGTEGPNSFGPDPIRILDDSANNKINDDLYESNP